MDPRVRNIKKNLCTSRNILRNTLAGLFRWFLCPGMTLYNSNLSMCGTFLKNLLSPPDVRELISAPEEAYDLNLSAVT